jgi:hypothetical protein
LTLAARVAADPSELPLSIAELLGAQYVDTVSDRTRSNAHPANTTFLEIPVRDGDMLVFTRAVDEPFTPAEVARAQRLSELAQQTNSVPPLG